MSKKDILKFSFVKSIPIMCSYLFIAMAYSMLMAENGFPWYDSLIVSMTVYTGAFQFVLTTLMSSGASLLTIAVAAFFMNSRQVFYSLTYVDEFNKMGRLKPYMIYTLTDETYAVNCSLELAEKDKRKVMVWVAFLSRCYWIIGTLAGGVIGQLIPFSLDGIDFCMTALFVVIFIDQWEKAKNHFPAFLGITVGIICLLIFGENKFMLPSLIIVSAVLILYNNVKDRKTVNGK